MAFDFTRLPMRGMAVGWTILLANVESYLDRRQIKRVMNALESPLPKSLEGVVTEEEHKEAARYSLDKLKFGQYEGIFSLIISVTSYWYLPALWNWTSSKIPLENEFFHTAAYMYLTVLPLSILTSFTFDLYRQFVIEEKHGFNKMTIRLYVEDFFKTQALMAALGLPILWLFIKIARWGGRQLYLYLWIFSVVVMLLMIAVIPVVVMPWFNKYEPLKNEELKAKIEALAGKLEFPLFKLEQVDGSKRSAHSNAFFYGFWRFKRIVLYDTLLDQPHDDILAILGHELGHWKMSHTKFNMGFQLVLMFVVFSLYGMVFDNPTIFTSFDYDDPTMSIALGFLLFSELWKPSELLITRMFIYITRVFEYQADAFAVNLGYGSNLVSALKNLTKDNKSFGDPDPVYSAWHYTHPTFVERRAAIETAQRNQDVAKSPLVDKESKKNQ